MGQITFSNYTVTTCNFFLIIIHYINAILTTTVHQCSVCMFAFEIIFSPQVCTYAYVTSTKTFKACSKTSYLCVRNSRHLVLLNQALSLDHTVLCHSLLYICRHVSNKWRECLHIFSQHSYNHITSLISTLMKARKLLWR